ncbi:MetQ/NlpA family lipoprotein [Klebsiella pneumoniae]|uniref:MetQ/NlpA family lipoprotein n=1 Tax=Klebsiella pneumoniae TaxID=573 RepID=UPI000F688B53|nr:MetQ/NlpA family lipoprotein [Klebsiella pneumoniae]MCC4980865.1 MetQ/NlpA family lipoprotein [Klebsiella pneumoniae]RRZ81482.1 MetQ/NlpA family lipoprotein [Klebsiella pneumoniae]RSA11678.1 MetQ/NlpA family lipoprotein [Klebsiella pneumoniae]
MRLRLRAAAAVMLAGLALVGCDQKGNEAKHIKVGVINGAEQDVAEVAKKVAKEKYGLEVELVGFSGSLLPNESTNAGRALLLLQKEKLITLKAGTGLLPTAVDITDNPRNLKIMELEGAQLPRVLDDPKVDVAIISTTYLQQTGLSPVRDGIFIEDKNSPYVNIIVTREDNKDAQNVKEFMQSYQSPEVAKAAETIFNGGAVPGW